MSRAALDIEEGKGPGAETRPWLAYHKGGTICARGQTLDGEFHGYWQWYRLDGTIKRSGHFDRGAQVGEWTTYDAAGTPCKTTRMKSRP